MARVGYLHLDGIYVEGKLLEQLLNNRTRHLPTMLVGPPGTGKTMLAKRMAFGGRFRAPHYTISKVGLVGNSKTQDRCEAALAHNGILFLDDFPEFTKGTIETLWELRRQGKKIVQEITSEEKIPSNFWILAAMNQCACGWRGTERKCECGGPLNSTYWARANTMMEPFEFDMIKVQGKYDYRNHKFYIAKVD